MEKVRKLVKKDREVVEKVRRLLEKNREMVEMDMGTRRVPGKDAMLCMTQLLVSSRGTTICACKPEG